MTARYSRIVSAKVIALALISISCSADIWASEDAEKLASANASFGFSLMKQLVGERSDANVFISPYSISAALQMVWQGAGGETKKEMDEALALGSFNAGTAGKTYKDLDNSIKSAGTNVALGIANSIWYAPNVELKPQFISVNQNLYGAKLSALDFTDPRSAGVVNSWVSEETHGKIKKIVEPPLSSRTGAFLANAIYFKGAWEHKFDSGATKGEPFHLRRGSQKPLPMMRQTRKFTYQEGTEFQAVRLPYAGGRLSMFLFLPATNSTPENLLAKLNAEVWREKIMPAFQEREGTVVVPRFKLQFKADLIPALKAIGIRHAFTQTADLSGISNTRLFVSGVEHASFVEVNEEGTEAAAATGVTVALTSFRQKTEPFRMIVDRPFFVVIEDSANKSILFMGAVNEPGVE